MLLRCGAGARFRYSLLPGVKANSMNDLHQKLRLFSDSSRQTAP